MKKLYGFAAAVVVVAQFRFAGRHLFSDGLQGKLIGRQSDAQCLCPVVVQRIFPIFLITSAVFRFDFCKTKYISFKLCF